MSSSVLLLYFHAAAEFSKANHGLISALGQQEHLSIRDMYAEYPRFSIDIDKEQSLLTTHDTIVLQFPMFWYSSPALLKEWQDLVLEYGFAYGDGGTALLGKRLQLVVTTGSPAEAYTAEGEKGYTLREFLRPFEAMAKLCHLDYHAPLAMHGARDAADNGQQAVWNLAYQKLIAALIAGRYPQSLAKRTDVVTPEQLMEAL